MRLAVLVLALAACGAAIKTVPLAAPWPSQPGGYDDAYERWTRRGEDHYDLIQTLTVSATLQSPEFRAAYVRERTERLGLSPDETAQLDAGERAAADAGWDVELLIATSKPELNDLKKLDKNGSMWHVALIADDGRQVDPISVKPDKRHRDDIVRWFPDLAPFYMPYLVHFPKTSPDGRPLVAPGSKRLSLEVAGSLGKVLLVWAADGA